MYNKVKTYDDLLETNIQFLKGKTPGTWYYGEKWGTGGDQKNHATNATTKNLIALHKKGFFSFGGQSSACGTYKPEEESEKMRDYLKNEGIVAYKQRSALAGFLPVELTQKLVPIFKKDKRIYYSVLYPNEEENESNIPYKFEGKGLPGRFNVTLHKKEDGSLLEITNSYEQTHKETVEQLSPPPRKYPAIKKILKEQAFVDVNLRGYCKGPEADVILLDAINNI